MTARKSIYAIVVLFIFLILGTALPAEAQVYNSVWEALSGDLPDEACPPWIFSESGTPEAPELVDGYLRLNSGTAYANTLGYGQKDDQLALQTTWTIEFEVNHVSGVINTGKWRTPCAVSFGVGLKWANALFIGPGEISVVNPDSPPNQGTKVITGLTGFQKYKIVIDLSTDPPHSFDVYVWIDGSGYEKKISSQTFQRTEPTLPDRWLSWGDLTAQSYGESHWRYFRHDGHITNPDINVTHTADDGSFGSLRWAINEANSQVGPNTINFNVSGTITLASPLPALTDHCTHILGGTAPDLARSVILDGVNIHTEPGLLLESNNNVIEDIVINHFWECMRINGNNNTVTGCHIGVDAAGVTRLPHGWGIDIIGDNNVIGGVLPEDRNVIAADSNYYAVRIMGNTNSIIGNYINIKATGDALLDDPNPGYSLFRGIMIGGGTGNRIGTSTPGSGNVICGCANSGIVILSDGNFVLRNYIGVDAGGLNILGNDYNGIEIHGNYNQIGDESGEGNVIAGSFEDGIALRDAIGNNVYGNKIGVDATGLNQAANSVGISIDGGEQNHIGSGMPGGGNIISGNSNSGIMVSYTINNEIIGNRIGINSGDAPMANGGHGISIGWDCEGTSIIADTIANNGEAGIAATGSETFQTRLNTFSQNIIYANTGLGIDLAGDGVTDNDPGDDDPGPNDLLNFPEIATVIDNGDGTFDISGNAAVDATVEFFIAGDVATVDPSGHGEAFEYLGSTIASSGNFTFTTPVVDPLVQLTTTATDVLGNTSEYSANISLPAPLSMSSHCPINMILEDPDLLRIGCDSLGNLINEIPGAEYHQNPDDSIFIPDPKPGTYTLYCVHEAGAPEDDTLYSSIIWLGSLPPLMAAVNVHVPEFGEMHSFTYDYLSDFHYLNGDANRDDNINIGDAVFLINYVFKGGPAPDPVLAGDANCDVEVNVGDAVRIIDHVFKGGQAPCYFEP
jgi:hypothetical protein